MWPPSPWPRSLRGRHEEGVGGQASGGQEGLGPPFPPRGGGLGLDDGSSRGTGPWCWSTGPLATCFHESPSAAAGPARSHTACLPTVYPEGARCGHFESGDGIHPTVAGVSGFSAAAAFLGTGIGWDTQPFLRPAVEKSQALGTT